MTSTHTNVLPFANSSFSTVVADAQFSNLGVALIALLARVGKICRLPENRRAEIEAKRLAMLNAGQISFVGCPSSRAQELNEDLGEAVQRTMADRNWPESDNSLELLTRTTVSDSQSIPVVTSGITVNQHDQHNLSKKRRAKGRKQPGNAIDNLFGSLA